MSAINQNRIEIKLTRDQARAVQQSFFPYLEMLTDLKIRENLENVDAVLSHRALKILFMQVVKQFNKKLDTQAMKFTFFLPLPNALAFYNLLNELPLQGHEVYALNLRQHLVSVIHRQMMAPHNLATMWLGR